MRVEYNFYVWLYKLKIKAAITNSAFKIYAYRYSVYRTFSLVNVEFVTSDLTHVQVLAFWLSHNFKRARYHFYQKREIIPSL